VRAQVSPESKSASLVKVELSPERYSIRLKFCPQ
jgi:hypothetical protein